MLAPQRLVTKLAPRSDAARRSSRGSSREPVGTHSRIRSQRAAAAPRSASPPPGAAPAGRARRSRSLSASRRRSAARPSSAQSFVLPHPRAAVWQLMSDVTAVARCMPGLSLDGPPVDDKVSGRLEAKIGPIAASFAGEGTLQPVPRRISTSHRGPRRGPAQRLARLRQRRLPALRAPAMPPDRRQRASMSSSATRSPVRWPRSAAPAWCATSFAASVKRLRRTSTLSCTTRPRSCRRCRSGAVAARAGAYGSPARAFLPQSRRLTARAWPAGLRLSSSEVHAPAVATSQWAANIEDMRIVLIPLLLALAVVLTAVILASRSKASQYVGAATRPQKIDKLLQFSGSNW